MSVSMIVLAGGASARMGLATPKPFLPLGKMLVVHHSLDLFCHSSEIDEVILVCPESYRSLCAHYSLQFANPGERRQDSLENGLKLARGEWICIHDAARPFVTSHHLSALITAGKEAGAASLALPSRATLKQVLESRVSHTLDRSMIWEAQTPQILSRSLLEEGFKLARKQQLTVTDDVSFAELLGHAPALVEGSARNFKLTTAEDYEMAKALCR